MADYIYTMEIRLTPDQLKGVSLIQEVARAAGMNLYLTGGAIRDIISGFTIRDLDFTVQGNPLKLQKELEKAGAHVAALEDESRTIFLSLPGNARAEISMARTERFDRPALVEAVRRTFHRRGTPIPAEPPIGLTPEFWAQPGRDAQVRAFARRARLATTSDSARDLGKRVAEFALPILRAAAEVPRN